MAMPLRPLLVPALSLGTIAPSSRAQSMALRDTARFLERVVNIMRQLATRPLPAGDTLVTWTTEPVLFRTSAIGGDTARAGMLCGDGTFGTTMVTWVDGQPSTFTVRWSTPGNPEHDAGLKLPYQDNRSALMHAPSFKRTDGDAVFSKARVINMLGNRAVHSHRPLAEADALVAVRELFHIAYRFAQSAQRRWPHDECRKGA